MNPQELNYTVDYTPLNEIKGGNRIEVSVNMWEKSTLMIGYWSAIVTAVLVLLIDVGMIVSTIFLLWQL